MYRRILVVVEAGAVSRSAISEAVALAKGNDAELVFFSVLPRYVMPVSDMPMMGALSPDEFQRSATESAQRHLAAVSAVAKQAGVRCSYAVGAGVDDAECIIEAAKQRRCGLIVVASVGRNAVLRLIMGSVIPGLITLSTIPVLVVRKPTSGNKVRRLAAVAPLPPQEAVELVPEPARRPVTAGRAA